MTSTTAKEIDVAVGARLSALMYAKRISQRHAAAALGMTQPAVYRRLRGAVPVSVGELFMFAELLGVPVTDLVNEDGPDTLSVKVSGPKLVRHVGLEPTTRCLRAFPSDLRVSLAVAA